MKTRIASLIAVALALSFASASFADRPSDKQYGNKITGQNGMRMGDQRGMKMGDQRGLADSLPSPRV